MSPVSAVAGSPLRRGPQVLQPGNGTDGELQLDPFTGCMLALRPQSMISRSSLRHVSWSSSFRSVSRSVSVNQSLEPRKTQRQRRTRPSPTSDSTGMCRQRNSPSGAKSRPDSTRLSISPPGNAIGARPAAHQETGASVLRQKSSAQPLTPSAQIRRGGSG